MKATIPGTHGSTNNVFFLQVCSDPNSFTIQTAMAAGMEAAMTDTLCSLDYIGISCNFINLVIFNNIINILCIN